MKTKPNDGGPAFPQPGLPYFRDGIPQNPNEGYGWAVTPAPGMTLRQYYAGQAMQGLIIHNDYGHVSNEDLAKGAVAHADALIAELEKETE